jgi:hypothetical protein
MLVILIDHESRSCTQKTLGKELFTSALKLRSDNATSFQRDHSANRHDIEWVN